MHLETWKRAQTCVATLAEGALVGRLDDFMFDLETHQIYGWRSRARACFPRPVACRPTSLVLGARCGPDSKEEAAEWSGGRISWSTVARGQCLPRHPGERRGRALGAVQDFVIDREGNQVTGVLLHGGLLLPLDGRVSTGPAAIIAESDDLVVEMPDEDASAGEQVAWWNRLTSAIGMGSSRAAIEDGNTIDVTDDALEAESVPAETIDD